MQSDRYSQSTPWAATCGAAAWSGSEILAMVLALLVFWPAGVALWLLKRWQRSEGHTGDLPGFVRARVVQLGESFGIASTAKTPTTQWRASGNTAFTQWRQGELDRLEAERRKLADSEREFAEHIDQLRRARDREEFESFMRARGKDAQ